MSTSALSGRILAVVFDHPGLSTVGVCREVRARKCDVLRELELLRREQLLRFERGARGAKSLLAVSEPSSCSRTCSRESPSGTEAADRDEVE
jgi:hypothetical protein